MTLKDDLIAAKALIDTPEKWLQNQRSFVCGTAGGGQPIRIAERYCAEGALERVGADPAAWRAAFAQVPRAFGSIAEFNDHSKHADIISLFDRAIAAAEAAS